MKILLYTLTKVATFSKTVKRKSKEVKVLKKKERIKRKGFFKKDNKNDRPLPQPPEIHSYEHRFELQLLISVAYNWPSAITHHR